ncbi:MAG: hypothetical protein EXS29_05500 [Pedosphaera sp.]|nr:hypothetical protein [Pedosphaera sp.]
MPRPFKNQPARRIARGATGVTLDARLKRVRFFLCDVDGVLTDASIFIGPRDEFKRFNILDGLGLRMLQHEGIRVGWVSRRVSVATTRRAKELKVDFLSQHNTACKVEAVEAILKKTGLAWDEICFVGDDVVDLGALRRVGVAVAVANAITEVKAVAHYVTRQRGGEGAVREVAELILRAQGRWERIIAEHSK